MNRMADLLEVEGANTFRVRAYRNAARILRAMDNPHFKILGYPSGRLIQRRPPYGIDYERIMKAARERGYRWLEAGDVVNTRNLAGLKKLLRRR